MTKSAVVTGGTGFLGYHLITKLLADGWTVNAIHRADSDVSAIRAFGVTLIEAELTDEPQLLKVFPTNVDAVFHTAGDTSLWSRHNDRQYQTNVNGTDIISEVAIMKGAKRFIHTSSISAYGFHDSTIDERTPSSALTSEVNYLKTKYLGEQVIKNKTIQGKLDSVILNPCAIIGSHDKHNWARLFTLINEGNLPGVPGGEGSYCYVGAVADAHLQAYYVGKCGQNYILAGQDHSFIEVVQKIGHLLDKPTPTKTVPDTILHILGDVSSKWSYISRNEPNMTPEKAKMVTKRVVARSDKATRELNYDANVSIDLMLQESYTWLLNNGYLSKC